LAQPFPAGAYRGFQIESLEEPWPANTFSSFP